MWLDTKQRCCGHVVVLHLGHWDGPPAIHKFIAISFFCIFFFLSLSPTQIVLLSTCQHHYGFVRASKSMIVPFNNPRTLKEKQDSPRDKDIQPSRSKKMTKCLGQSNNGCLTRSFMFLILQGHLEMVTTEENGVMQVNLKTLFNI